MLLALAETIELKDQYTKGHCDRVANHAVTISRELGLPEDLIKEKVEQIMLGFRGCALEEELVDLFIGQALPLMSGAEET